MNGSFFASDRVTHVKVGMTALLATALVIVVGVYAKPVDAAHGQAMRIITGPSLIATPGRGLLATLSGEC